MITLREAILLTCNATAGGYCIVGENELRHSQTVSPLLKKRGVIGGSQYSDMAYGQIGHAPVCGIDVFTDMNQCPSMPVMVVSIPDECLPTDERLPREVIA